jgi:hypothetical protein
VQVKCKNYLILVESTKQIGQNQLVGLDWDTDSIHVMVDKVKRAPNEFRF